MVDTDRAATERWFVRQGLPHAIVGYSATEDVLTRASPFLAVVVFLELFLAFDDRVAGWAQAGVFVLGVGSVVGGVMAVNRLRGRRWFQLPDDIGVPEVTGFVLVPAVVPVLVSDQGLGRGAAIVVGNTVIVGLAYLITSYGVLPALRVGARQAAAQIRTVASLLARVLPLLLLITTFVFLNAEMWQVAHDFETAYFVVLIASLLLITTVFLALRLPREIEQMARFDSWASVAMLADRSSAPLDSLAAELVPDDVPTDGFALDRVERVNVGVLLTMGQVVQVVLVGAVVWIFYLAFGALAVREATILQWTTATVLDPLVELSFLGGDVVITWEHLAVSSFIAAFSMLQFAVASVTDDTYRREFFEEVALGTREVLAVRALYRAAHATGSPEVHR